MGNGRDHDQRGYRRPSAAVAANIADPAYLATRPIVRIHLLGSMQATSYLRDDVLSRAKKAAPLSTEITTLLACASPALPSGELQGWRASAERLRAG